MLTGIKIRNFVLIENLELEFCRGLNILTGETGAGKSILIDAISGILGEKMSTDMIRTGFDRAILEGIFEIEERSEVKSLLSGSGIDCEDNEIIIKRELYSNGKGRCFINSTQVPVAKIKEIGEYLLVIHGQNEQQSISRTSRHRELLDNFGDNEKAVETVRNLYAQLSNIKEKIESNKMDEREKNRKIEYLSFAIKEISSAGLKLNEEEDLKEESNILSNSEKLFKHIKDASEYMRGDSGVIQNLKRAEKSLSIISDIDPNVTENLEAVRNALYTLEDSATFLREYEQSINFSPERINEVEERLSLISSFKKKYGNSIKEILEFREKSENELESISSSEEAIEKLNERHKQLIAETKAAAVELSDRRVKAAKILEEKVMSELNELNMKGTTFRVSVQREINSNGEIEHNGKTYMLYPHGLDRIEFLMAANEGSDLVKLVKAASGGEMSRIMLALKKVILSKDIVDTLIFDEVDAGISGKTAEIVGRKLKSLAAERQVLVITHLAQIAAMSDNHYSVHKYSEQGKTFTSVKHLSRKDKVDEVARMLAGEKITDLSIQHAEEMISMAEKS
ncbi:MAG: DNA repair protein RecN [Spirochaetes bacterium]|nr:DNA repair protein RecN [Spirochaetota bacterium]